MPKLIFRGAFIRFVDLRYDEKSKTTYTKLNFTTEFSEPVREAMEWGEPPAGWGGGDLDGTLTATNLILTPNGRELKQHELSLDCNEISKFEYARVRSADGFKGELRFQITTAIKGAAAIVEAYIDVIGKGEAQLRVGYEQQSEMELGAGKEDRQISEEQARDTSEETDEPSGAPLAPAAVMGGTHQSRKRVPKDVQ